MTAARRLGVYAAGVAAVFAGAYAVAAVVVPDSAVADWQAATETAGHTDMSHEGSTEPVSSAGLRGLSLADNGLVLSPVTAPGRTGEDGTLSYRIVDAAGAPVTGFATAHEKQMHLIVVRTDGSQYRHVHPVMDAAGTWSLPWQWQAAGTYRMFADFVPATPDAGSSTLTRTLQVAGDFTPVTPPGPSAVDEIDGFRVEAAGDLVAGASSELTLTVTKDGQPVTTLEPYLGAFGHLVALRDGDLGYLHVHAEGAEPAAGATAGPSVSFMAEAPTAGRYLLYLDFQIAGQVHTAEFVLDAGTAGRAAGASARPAQSAVPSVTPSTSHGADGHGH